MSLFRKIGRVFNAVRGSTDKYHSNAIVLMPGHFSEFDPFLMMAEDWVKPPAGFPDHPHRGFETVTLVLEGQIRHTDSKGNTGILKAGEVQWMTAGRGIIHSEMPEGNDGFHSLQLWLNLPKVSKMIAPSYQDLRLADIPVRYPLGGDSSNAAIQVRVISGRSGDVRAPTKNNVPVKALEVIMQPQPQPQPQQQQQQEQLRLVETLPPHYNGFIYVLSGRGKFGSGADAVLLSSGKVCTVPPLTQEVPPAGDEDTSSSLEITCESRDEPLRFVFFAGPPIREPVVQRGPFVMNTAQEIQQAHIDFMMGRFGQ